MKFVSFMQSSPGRVARAVVGAAMIVAGLAVGGAGGIILAVAGLLPLSAGVFRVCFVAPLLGCGLRDTPQTRG